MSDQIIPNTVVFDPNNPTAGMQVDVTVILNETTSVNQSVTITSSPAGFFSSIPSSINIGQGLDRGSFQATLSTGASGSGTITASCNGGQSSGMCAPIL